MFKMKKLNNNITVTLGYAVLIFFFLPFVKPKATASEDEFKILPDPSLLLQNRTKPAFIYKSYIRNIVCKALYSSKPRTLQDLQDIIQYALKYHVHVKALGSLHSINDVICTDGIAVIMSNIKHFSFDPQTNRATVGAGSHLLEFMEKLDQHGRSLTSTPLYGEITIGGAIATGVHGSSLKEFTTLSDQIVSMTIVDGLGNIRTISAEEEDFKAFRIHLGLLGIIYEVTFETVPQYKIEIQSVQKDEDILFQDNANQILNYARNGDKFSFWWFPLSKKVVLSLGTNKHFRTPGDCQNHVAPSFSLAFSVGFAETFEIIQKLRDFVSYSFVEKYSKLGFWKEIPARTPAYTQADGITSCLPVSVGKSYHMTLFQCGESCPWLYGDKSLFVLDVSIAIAVEELPRALKTIKNIIDESLLAFPAQGIFFRFVKASNAYMSMSNSRDVVDIELNPVPRRDSTQPVLGITAVQAITKALIEKHGGRPHWAKNGLFYTNPNIIRKAFPEYTKFVEVMEKIDPHGIFMNDMGERIKNGRNVMTLRPDMAVRCALNEACECRKESDCGNGGPLDFTCGRFMGFNVCKRKPNILGDLKEVAARNTIATSNTLIEDVDQILTVLSPFEPFKQLPNSGR